MDRMTQRLQDATRANAALSAALLVSSPSDLERDGTIQRFEFTYEAVWKLGQTYLETQEGLRAPSPPARTVISFRTNCLSRRVRTGASPAA